MPISYVIDMARNLVLTTASGTLTDDDVIQLKTRLAQDPDVKHGMSELSDIRNIDCLAVTSVGITAMARQDEREAAQRAPHRLALVVSDRLTYGMARMYQSQTEPNKDNVGVFRDIDKAESWLQSK